MCENCAFPDEDLVLVRRVYVTPETWDTPASHQVVEEPDEEAPEERVEPEPDEEADR